MSKELKDRVAWWLTYFVLAIIVIGGLALIYPNYQRGQALKRDNKVLQEQIEQKRREIARIEDCQRRFRTDSDFVETIARQNHRVFPGELVFVFDKKD